MEIILIIGVVIVIGLQLLNLKKEKTNDNNLDTSNLENRLKDIEDKINLLPSTVENSVKLNIVKEISGVNEKLGKNNQEVIKTLGDNNQILTSKFVELDRKVDQKLSETAQTSLKSSNDLRNDLMKDINAFKEVVNKTLDGINKNTIKEISSMSIKLEQNNQEIIKILGENNQTLTSKFMGLEKKVDQKLSETSEASLKSSNALRNDLMKDIHTFTETVNKTLETINVELVKHLGDIDKNVQGKLSHMTENTITSSNQLKEKLNKDMNDFKSKLEVGLKENFDKLNKNVTSSLDRINEKVEDKLREGFEKTNKTFSNILERLSKIDEAQKKIDSLSTDIVSLQDVLTDKKSRGIFGEVQLNQVLYSIFGEKNDKAFKTQYQLSNGTIVDSILFAPEPVGAIAIDSKFPLENYKKMIDKDATELERKEATKAFKLNIKSHINAIADKYIIPKETSSQAIMFLPAEAIFAEINAYHPDLVEYAQSRKVWICSPTTLMAVLTTLQVVLQNVEREKHAHIIQEELVKLGTEFKRYTTRWNNLAKHIDTVSKDVKEIHTTTSKIGNRFESIKNVKLQENVILEVEN